MITKEQIESHLKVVCRLIADTEYHFQNLQYLKNLEGDEKKLVDNSFALQNYRTMIWYKVVLDLCKLLNDNHNDKFNIRKLIEIVKQSRYKAFWKHQVDITHLKAYEVAFFEYNEMIVKIIEVRDEHVAHFDNKEVHYKISLDELSVLIEFCKTIFNYISNCLNDGTTDWINPDMILIKPVIRNLTNYNKLRSLFFEKHRANESVINMEELNEIFRPYANKKS